MQVQLRNYAEVQLPPTCSPGMARICERCPYRCAGLNLVRLLRAAAQHFVNPSERIIARCVARLVPGRHEQRTA